jgi:hypothetical protein
MWMSMLHTYRRDAVPHEYQTTASCTPCHGSSRFEDAESRQTDPRKFQQAMHREHEINIQTNMSCAHCHVDAPGATTHPIDD